MVMATTSYWDSKVLMHSHKEYMSPSRSQMLSPKLVGQFWLVKFGQRVGAQTRVAHCELSLHDEIASSIGFHACEMMDSYALGAWFMFLWLSCLVMHRRGFSTSFMMDDGIVFLSCLSCLRMLVYGFFFMDWCLIHLFTHMEASYLVIFAYGHCEGWPWESTFECLNSFGHICHHILISSSRAFTSYIKHDMFFSWSSVAHFSLLMTW